MKKLEWLIVGGGPQGVHLACCLLADGVPLDELLILDRFEKPLHLWTEHTSRLKMGYLRSSAVHHLDVEPFSFVRYAKRKYGPPPEWSAPPYQRPKYDVFQDHCSRAMEKYGVRAVYHQAEVLSVEALGDGYRVESDVGVFEAGRVVLAVGQPGPRIPKWVDLGNAAIQHILSPSWSPVSGRVVVIGAGMTGAQFALCQAEKPGEVTLVAPDFDALSDFDADPCWIGPKCRTPEFESSPAAAKRRAISEARLAGTLNPQVHDQLFKQVGQGRIKLKTAHAVGLNGDVLKLSTVEELPFDHLVLATGFQKVRPGGELVDNLIEELELPISECGFPITSQNLEWRSNLFVTGGLAELTIGPVARNITGGRTAARRIIKGARLGQLQKRELIEV